MTAPQDGRHRGLILQAEYGNMLACIKCGACLQACPTYRLTQREDRGPRGRIQLARAWTEGHLDLTDDLAAAQDTCLVCDACTTVCPAGVRMEPLMMAVRAAMAQQRPATLTTRALLSLVQRRGALTAMASLARGAAILRLLGPLQSLVPGARLGQQLRIDTFSPRGQTWQGRRGGPTVGLLAGCIQSVVFGSAIVATARTLAAAGATVIAPAGQGCCGALHAHNGQPEAARAIAMRTLAPFLAAEVDVIAVNSAGCGAWLKHIAPAVPGAPRVADYSELLAELAPALPRLQPVQRRVTWQDPCHLLHVQRIRQQPRDLLALVPGLEVVELPDQAICCGSAGISNLTEPATGDALGDAKAAAIIAAGVDAVVSANPGCMLQLRAALQRAGSTIPVVHLAELLAEALQPESDER